MRTAVLIAGIAAGLAASAQPAQAQPGEALETAQRLVMASGVAEQLKWLPKQFEAELQTVRGAVPDELLAAMVEAARESFVSATLQEDIRQTLAAGMPVGDMNQAIAWLETAGGRRVTRAEERASATLSPQALQTYVASLDKAPLSARRIGLIGDLVGATRGVEHSARIAEGVALGIAVGMDSTQPVQRRQGLKALQTRLRNLMPPEQVREAMGAVIHAVYAYTYRAITDEDLAAYLEFNRSAAGARYNDAMIAAVSDAMLRASLRMGVATEKALRKKPV